VQTDAFFEPTPVAALNGFFKSLFRVRSLSCLCQELYYHVHAACCLRRSNETW
jgi:hypothetical protein